MSNHFLFDTKKPVDSEPLPIHNLIPSTVRLGIFSLVIDFLWKSLLEALCCALSHHNTSILFLKLNSLLVQTFIF
jgi:hypothetical protein